MDLAKLGAVLKARREEVGIPKTVLAQRVGITPGYIWMVEEARIRKKSGKVAAQPSRPSREVLERWAAVLGLDEDESEELLVLAGHSDGSIVTTETPLLAFGGFGLPTGSNAEQELLKEIRSLLSNPKTRSEILRDLESFIGWLYFRYGGKK
jgi:transcriptional regulator with XRE-family HTH domain